MSTSRTQFSTKLGILAATVGSAVGLGNDFISSNILMPLGGLGICLFIGWKMDSKEVENQLRHENGHKNALYRYILFCIRYVAPAGILTVFIAGLPRLFHLG